MTHNDWLADVIGTDSIRHASQKVGFAATTITRQLQRGGLSADMVIALCRAYGRKPVDGLVETGYLQPWEIEGVGITDAIDRATNQELLDGIMRRSDPESTVLFGGDDDTIDIADDAEVYPFPGTPQSDAYDQPEPENPTPNVHGEWQGEIPDDAVADDSPEEEGAPDDFEP